VINGEVLRKVKEERNILHTTRREANWTGHIFYRNCLLTRVVKGEIERIGRRRRRHKQLLDDLKEKRIYWNKTAKSSATI
jgi:hypothetical protein